jgi:hypothetical protein
LLTTPVRAPWSTSPMHSSWWLTPAVSTNTGFYQVTPPYSSACSATHIV